MAGVDRDKLRAALKAAGRSARAVSLDAGLGATAIKDILSGKSQSPAASTVAAIETELSLPPGALLGSVTGVGAQRLAALAPLPLLGPAKAGTWVEQDDAVQDEPQMLSAVLDRRYPHAAQWLRPVVGDSMNARGIFPGDLAHIVDFAGAGVDLETGQIVEVTRYRAGGALREITLKEAEVTPSGVRLWPRSTNPAWKAPLTLTEEGDDQEVVVRVTGLLLAAIKRF